MLNAPAVHEVSVFGRDAELAAIRSLLAAAADGHGGALVLAAGPGEGRTAVVRAAASMAAGFTVLAAPGHAGESGLVLGGLQRLLEPLAGLLEELPPEQRAPLAEVVAGRDPAAGPLLLGLSTLALLRLAGRRGPVLCLVDDADLLDPPSWQQFRLVARRLDRLPVVLLAGVGVTAGAATAAAGLPVRRLTALDDAAGGRLLSRLAPDLTPDVTAGLVDLAAGHPGALVDLVTALTPEQRRGFLPPPTALPADSTVRIRGRAALAALPPATRRLLLLAAADPDARPADLVTAANQERSAPGPAGLVTAANQGRSAPGPAGLVTAADRERTAPGPAGLVTAAGQGCFAAVIGPVSPAATLADLEPAERAGLAEITAAGLRFTPAVMRSVAYDEAPIGRRHAAHRALAEVLRGRGQRLRALLHEAAVASAPDDELARDLLDAAEGASPREAFRARRHAAALGSDPAGAARAAVAAARSAMAAGRPQDARPLLTRAAQLRGGALVTARARGLIAEMRLRGAPAEARDVLLDVAAELLPTDPVGAVDALLVAGEACGRAGQPGRYPVLARRAAARCLDGQPGEGHGQREERGWLGEEHGRLGEENGQTGGEFGQTARLGGTPGRAGREMALHQVVGMADLMTGDDDAAFAHLGEVLRLADRTSDPAALIRAANTSILLGQDQRAARLAGRAATLARTAGNAPLVPEALEVAVFAELAAGRYDQATEAALDGVAVARGAGRPDLADAHLVLLGLIAAFVGDRETGRHRVAAATAGHPAAEVRALGDWAESLLDLVAGHPEAASARLAGIVAGGGSMILRVAVVPHLLEAAALSGATRLGGPAEAAAAFDRWAGRTGQAGWLALRARCRALTDTDADAAEDHFREALGWHEETGFARAHTELLYGHHLRRRRRPAEARDHLRRAGETFQRLDARPWADQAARELRAAGERIGPVDRGPLTAQQERIAGLVAEGATNREVARQLHLSPRTIDHHLRNVFARLGVRSRTELARLLAG